MSFRVLSAVMIAPLACCLLAGCISTAKVKSENQVSVGQQLTDLESAYQRGIITEKEYRKLKKAIIKNND
jgi:outer membrane murein-binding lipoprotein Lpp